jgi:hypothetical protein
MRRSLQVSDRNETSSFDFLEQPYGFYKTQWLMRGHRRMDPSKLTKISEIQNMDGTVLKEASMSDLPEDSRADARSAIEVIPLHVHCISF